MGQLLLQDPLHRHRRGCYSVQLLSLIFILAAIQSDAHEHIGSVIGCIKCPEEQYFNFKKQGCEPCTKCLGGLVERLPCANGDPLYCDKYGQFDRLCCATYEYEVYGECVLNCRKCKVTGKCKPGTTECDCPSDRYGKLCQFIVPSSEATIEDDPTMEITVTPTLPVAMTTTHYLVSPTPTPLINKVD